MFKAPDYDLNKQPWRPIRPFEGEDTVPFDKNDAQIERRKDEFSLVQDDIVPPTRLHNNFMPNIKRKDHIESGFNNKDGFSTFLYGDSKIPVRQNDKVQLLDKDKMPVEHQPKPTNNPVYTSFTNPALNDMKIERLGATNVKPHPIPVNKISTDADQEIPDFKYLSTAFKEEISTLGDLLNSAYSSTEGINSKNKNDDDFTKTLFEKVKTGEYFNTVSTNSPDDYVTVQSTEKDILSLEHGMDVLEHTTNFEKSADDKVDNEYQTSEYDEQLTTQSSQKYNIVKNNDQIVENFVETTTIINPVSIDLENSTSYSELVAIIAKNTEGPAITSPTGRPNMHLIYNSTKNNSPNRTVSSFVEVETLKYNPGSGSNGNPGSFQSSKWEYVNGTKIPARNSTHSNKVFNETLQALVVHNSTPKPIHIPIIPIRTKEHVSINSKLDVSSLQTAKPVIQSPISVDLKKDDDKIMIKHKDAPLQNLSSIFDSISSKLGISPNIQTKTPPFRLTTKKHTTPRPQITQIIDSSENFNQGVVEPVDPNIAEMLLKNINSKPLENIAPEVVTLRPVKSNTGVNGNLRPKPKQKTNETAIETRNFVHDRNALYSTIFSKLQEFEHDKSENMEQPTSTEDSSIKIDMVTSISEVTSVGKRDTSTAMDYVTKTLSEIKLESTESTIQPNILSQMIAENVSTDQTIQNPERSKKYIVSENKNIQSTENKNSLLNEKNKSDEFNIHVSVSTTVTSNTSNSNPQLSTDHLKFLANIATISDSNNNTFNYNNKGGASTKSLPNTYTINQAGFKILTKTFNKIPDQKDKGIKGIANETIGKCI